MICLIVLYINIIIYVLLFSSPISGESECYAKDKEQIISLYTSNFPFEVA